MEALEDSTLSSWLGGRGLGSYLLWKNLKNGVDPLSSENVLIFATGPATATKMPGASRYGVYSKSPQTNFFADSYAGGHIAPQMKKTGYDAFVIHGASLSPVFLEVASEGVKFWDALDLWGSSTYETEEKCLSKVNTPGAQALVIGPAGENLVRFACIVNNRWRNAGRTGMGAVMGSKKLKAMVFHGRIEPELAYPKLLDNLAGDIIERGKKDPTAQRYRKFGTPMLVATTNLAGAFPTEYWSAGTLPGWERISADTMQTEFEVKATACTRCFLACGKLAKVIHGRHKGLTIEGPEYETIYSFGGLCKIVDLAEIMYLNDICDKLGIDTISAGNLVALCMELSKRGRLSEKIDYGNPDHAAELLYKICRREGLGDTLAQGINMASEVLNAKDLAIHVKGLEPSGYDPRVLKGMSLGYSTSPRGACHLPATFYIFELRGVVEPSAIQGKAESYIGYEDRLTIMDTMILCRFFRDLIGWPELIKLISATTGLRFNEPELRQVSNNITTLRHLINIKEGWQKEDDRLPLRLLQEPINGNLVTEDELGYMLSEYYHLRGWDENGKPPEGFSVD